MVGGGSTPPPGVPVQTQQGLQVGLHRWGGVPLPGPPNRAGVLPRPAPGRGMTAIDFAALLQAELRQLLGPAEPEGPPTPSPGQVEWVGMGGNWVAYTCGPLGSVSVGQNTAKSQPARGPRQKTPGVLRRHS